MATHLSRVGGPLCILAVALGACATHESDLSSETTITRAVVPNGDAIEKVSRVRCRREAECNNIGVGRYANVGDCLVATREREEKELTPDACPVGLKKRQLDTCLAALADQVCESPLGLVRTVPECGTGQLCPQ
jgi:hypothetical protein